MTMDELMIRELVCSDKLGIDSLPEQLMKKHIEEGFVFNILLIGETGIGKSTLASSLFNIPLCASVENHFNSKVKLHSKTYHLSEKSVNVRLTVIETVGYGDQINREDNVTPIIQYIESQFESYFNEELKAKRSLLVYRDTRIHACLYCICPTGHNLKSLDIFCMKQLHNKVNIIPIIAKSDCLSVDEQKKFKATIRATIERENIKIYYFPTDDEKLGDSNSKSNDIVPFAITASEEYVLVGGKLTRARTFPWGTMLVENADHSEYLALKHALIEVNMEHLREKTNDEFYEEYRVTRLVQLGRNISEEEPLTTVELFEKQREKLQREMQEDEEKVKERFAAKVRAKDEELMILENSINSKYRALFEELKNEQDRMNHEKIKLDAEIFAFQAEVKKKRNSVAKRQT